MTQDRNSLIRIAVVTSLYPPVTNSNARINEKVQLKKYIPKSWLWTSSQNQGFAINMDKDINKAQVVSGLFGLITAKLEEAHGASINGQSINTTLEIEQEAINELRMFQGEIAILLFSVEMIEGL